MSDLSTIDDLLKEKPANDDGQALDTPEETKDHVDLHISSPEIEKKFKKKMGQVAIKEREREAAGFAASLGLPHIDLEKFPIGQEALKQVSFDDAKRLGTICFFSTPDEFRLGSTQPDNEEVRELFHQVEEKKHASGALYVISKNSLDRTLKLYANLPIIKAISKDVEIKEEDLKKVQADVKDFSSFQKILDKQSTTDLVVLLLGAALKLEASDLHVEAEEEEIVVRVRLDGILHDAATLKKEVYKKLVSRVKLFSSLKINITNKPQDGRFTIKLEKGDVDVRVSTIPTVYGESIVMRLLDQSRKGLELSSLGLYGDTEEKLRREITRPNGMIVTTGPTGSGKTTTLYAVLETLNKPGVKIITLEDPVEYKMEGINQSQIDTDKGFTFAKGLRSILRQDPDIVMVGEIRDLDTADTSVQAALTGHLMFSTVHTNSAAGAIPRFVSMGVKPFLLAPALNAIIGQRLVRRVCEKCKEKIELDDKQKAEVEKFIATMPEKAKAETTKKELVFYKGGGCDACGGIGYKGRIGIYEILLMNTDIEQMVLAGNVAEHDIEQAAINAGMVTMVQDGIIKALEGLTSLDEVFRVID
ncbi:MAG: Flp pilus assembly complex ATPase component TadA [Candidatus Magasanikbacteria bacterium]|jgi:type IV pilus assembly protein PilB|nr:Flp pilus assembly complex ATPase component TadA [Candidatus Magasanikbacteria bacterium]MBT4315185.1 Flp pilus assembly complex ATPase component TadA [Candidatus Magasanikbacteria bacterium]MBT4547358.1 Flp pilus assembly complex ATPase component TadA [Candidatus Magasanikbacteria bacterium]MBT6819040.1 Flp pilus assembly complex ATPase component TadA [Candidatus Magasanikbacteria bacterium]